MAALRLKDHHPIMQGSGDDGRGSEVGLILDTCLMNSVRTVQVGGNGQLLRFWMEPLDSFVFLEPLSVKPINDR